MTASSPMPWMFEGGVAPVAAVSRPRAQFGGVKELCSRASRGCPQAPRAGHLRYRGVSVARPPARVFVAAFGGIAEDADQRIVTPCIADTTTTWRGSSASSMGPPRMADAAGIPASGLPPNGAPQRCHAAAGLDGSASSCWQSVHQGSCGGASRVRGSSPVSVQVQGGVCGRHQGDRPAPAWYRNFPGNGRGGGPAGHGPTVLQCSGAAVKRWLQVGSPLPRHTNTFAVMSPVTLPTVARGSRPPSAPAAGRSAEASTPGSPAGMAMKIACPAADRFHASPATDKGHAGGRV